MSWLSETFIKVKGSGLESVITECIQPTFTFTSRSLDISRPFTVGAVCSHGTLAFIPHRYPFIHLGGEKQCRLNFLLKEISGKAEARTRDPSIPKRALYHWTTAAYTAYSTDLFYKYQMEL